MIVPIILILILLTPLLYIFFYERGIEYQLKYLKEDTKKELRSYLDELNEYEDELYIYKDT